MAAMALNSIPFLANAWETTLPFPLRHHREARPAPTLSLRERELAARAFVFRNQSLTVGGMDLQAGLSPAPGHSPLPPAQHSVDPIHGIAPVGQETPLLGAFLGIGR